MLCYCRFAPAFLRSSLLAPLTSKPLASSQVVKSEPERVGSGDGEVIISTEIDCDLIDTCEGGLEGGVIVVDIETALR